MAWETDEPRRYQRHNRWRVGRLQVGYDFFIHRSPNGDRWVILPYLIWDRK